MPDTGRRPGHRRHTNRGWGLVVGVVSVCALVAAIVVVVMNLLPP